MPQEVMQEDADTVSEESESGAWAASAGSADSCASLSMDSSGSHSPRCAVRARDSSPVDCSPSKFRSPQIGISDNNRCFVEEPI